MHLREPFPLRTYIALSLLGLGSGFVGALSGATIASHAHRVAITIPIIDPAPTAEVVTVAAAVSARTERQPAPSNKPGFVIEVDGARWMVLDVDAQTIVSRRAAHLVDGEYPTEAIARLRDRDLTPELRAWRGQPVIVDGTCTDTLRDFAVISQLSGDPAYADDSLADHPRWAIRHGEGDEAQMRWTAAGIEANGVHLVAAKLATCTGTFARAASAPAAVPFGPIEDASALADQAATRLLASETGRAAQARIDQENLGDSQSQTDFNAATQVETKVARDPRTGAVWIAVHAHADFACGGPEINFFGLYRASEGTLMTVREEASPDLAGVEALVDLDGDGVPELVGNGWISPTRAFYDQDLAPLVSYQVPF
ncbi:MAG TPA: hypothetical protein VIV58_17675, partial [Kofleriaceae bacterium]